MTEQTPLQKAGVRVLTPENTRLFTGRLGSLHCVVDNSEAFANVYCLFCFPITFPDRYISVSYTDAAAKEQEIGVILDPAAFPEETRALVTKSLNRHYFEQLIDRIIAVKFEYGLLFLTVETREGKREFMMRWEQSKALDHGKSGKVLLDAHGNRYVIPDMGALPKADRERLVRFIYW